MKHIEDLTPADWHDICAAGDLLMNAGVDPPEAADVVFGAMMSDRNPMETATKLLGSLKCKSST